MKDDFRRTIVRTYGRTKMGANHVFDCGHEIFAGSGMKYAPGKMARCYECREQAWHAEKCGKHHCASCCLDHGLDRPIDHLKRRR